VSSITVFTRGLIAPWTTARLTDEIQRQASMVGYINAFRLMTLAPLLTAPLAFLFVTWHPGERSGRRRQMPSEPFGIRAAYSSGEVAAHSPFLGRFLEAPLAFTEFASYPNSASTPRPLTLCRSQASDTSLHEPPLALVLRSIDGA
jgi:hypothetical protein